MPVIKTFRIVSEQFDPFMNLSLEEALLDQVQPGQIIFYLWQNDHTVVIGRNQNPWQECRVRLLESSGGRLARRLSGGGAVYHDLGNLNFTFAMDKALYDQQRQLDMVAGAVNRLGIPAVCTGRNDILVNGCKFSGNAFYFRTQTALHHGTILVDADLEKVPRFLSVSPEKLASKGIGSVRSRVLNLKALNATLTIDKIKETLLEAFDREYGQKALPVEETVGLKRESIDRVYQKYVSDAWRYGATPDFNVRFGNRFEWGEVEFLLDVHLGHVQSVTLFSDSLEPDIITAMGECLKGVAFTRQAMVGRLEDMLRTAPHRIIKDQIHYLENHPVFA
ncbi:MAG: lipoate--protein ligase [Desulfobacterales bacterium]|nr:lipoate--protein ligase [Desulfobacterales bacterium]MDD4071854.1 lipoate--protein ligase [Desulfobacterales bacterium]MDD4391515.1 lipoate--protein ligase [Desulfobacterales bacterium]